jgi:hypothetical protein
VAQAPSGQWISFSAISADGGAVYYSTFSTPSLHKVTSLTGQIRVADVATGRSHVVYTSPAQPGLITPDPGVRYLLLQIERFNRPEQLLRLDLATGKATDLRFSAGGVLYW